MKTKLVILLAGFSSFLMAVPAVARAASSSAKVKVTQAQLQKVLDRLDAVERQNRAIADENRDLRTQVLQLQQQIQPAAAVKSSVNQQVKAQVQEQVAPLAQQVNEITAAQRELPFGVGFRAGYSESPYGMPGGFRYSAFLNYRLLTEEDGVPFGDVSGELEAALVLGNGKRTVNNLGTILVPALGAQKTWIDEVEIQPTVQYHLNLASAGFRELAQLKPYLLAGPGVWISMLSTPVVNTAKGAGQGFRHTDADTQAGGVFGVGTKYSLAGLSVPPIQGILDKISVGAEYRFNLLANGWGFNQYTGSVQFGF